MPPKEEKIEIPFGAKDSELCEWEYTIPSGYKAEVKDGKVIVRKKEEPLTPFEQGCKDIFDTIAINYSGRLNVDEDIVKIYAKEILALAFGSPEFKLALQKSWDNGNLIGYGAGQRSVEKDLPK